jgi:hypothetical protein
MGISSLTPTPSPSLLGDSDHLDYPPPKPYSCDDSRHVTMPSACILHATGWIPWTVGISRESNSRLVAAFLLLTRWRSCHHWNLHCASLLVSKVDCLALRAAFANSEFHSLRYPTPLKDQFESHSWEKDGSVFCGNQLITLGHACPNDIGG